MARRLFQRYLPGPASLRTHSSLRFLGPLLDRHSLWQLNRRSTARAMGVGLFAALMPLPLQMLLAAALALPARANLPLAVSLVWLTNPLTMPPVFYCTYKVGAWLLGVPPRQFPGGLSWAWITQEMAALWQPFLVGSVVSGVVLGGVGYFATLALWRWQVSRQWARRSRPPLGRAAPRG